MCRAGKFERWINRPVHPESGMRGEQSDGGNNISFGFADAPKDSVSSGSFSFGKGRGTVTGRFLVSFVVVKRDGLGVYRSRQTD